MSGQNDRLAAGAPRASYLLPPMTQEKWESLWEPDASNLNSSTETLPSSGTCTGEAAQRE